ncbi:hypothetical protein FE374_03230 [Georgenia yuyongxinii]|uniref:Biotin/methionine sulfoxide reductase n=1 Tax=Georgenia yuyongxinii TaxID=2589797 RepID=A0A5B8C160_9MICO|nr:molybdopterin-dependent oxidoreductase [Georgenia yuyongxinii]QDC23770.1 hypothetical protein FE374_03230 [Georgenia yuyongxinii]
MSSDTDPRVHHSHWGAFTGRLRGGDLEVAPHPVDPDPSPLLGNIPEAAHHATRVGRPMIRRSWLEEGPGRRDRSDEDFVEVSWQQALDLAAQELARVRGEHGNSAIYGKSYGWGSAGRFHHAQSQVHRFLNVIGGHVSAIGTYSAGCAETFWPLVLGEAGRDPYSWHSWQEISENTELLLAFGGLPRKNMFVSSGGIARHRAGEHLQALHERGGTIVSISPIRDDAPANVPAQWVSMRPFGDVPMILAMCYVLVVEGLHDEHFLSHYTVGAEKVIAYILGTADGVAKTPAWAANLCGVPPQTIEELARRAASSRTLINLTHSLQRAENGEQPLWAALTLAALLGQIGEPGCGVSYPLGSMANSGERPGAVKVPSLPQPPNAVDARIPVARIADMLLDPGGTYRFRGETRTYPDIRLVYWVGGNPFHHHQDLFRLMRAFEVPETVIVHEQYWTATARRADIVLPATTTLERRDFSAGKLDSRVVAMEKLIAPYGQARDDYDIFAGLSERLGLRDEFTEGRTGEEWVDHLLRNLLENFTATGFQAPTSEEFWQLGGVDIPPGQDYEPRFARFRADPERNALTTPSGKIELFSQQIAAAGVPSCPGHAYWSEPSQRVDDREVREGFLQLVANNPPTRLHSQLDVGAVSQRSKVQGREPLRMHPADARLRGITDGNVVRVASPQGACLAGAVVTEAVRPGVVQLATGAWFQPEWLEDGPTCVHGNPNAVTVDVGTSALTQGCSGQLARVTVVRYDGPLPPVRVTTSSPEGRSRR